MFPKSYFSSFSSRTRDDFIQIKFGPAEGRGECGMYEHYWLH